MPVSNDKDQCLYMIVTHSPSAGNKSKPFKELVHAAGLCGCDLRH